MKAGHAVKSVLASDPVAPLCLLYAELSLVKCGKSISFSNKNSLKMPHKLSGKVNVNSRH